MSKLAPTVDRGKFSSTVLGDGCKSTVQIGHNSKLGRFCIMAGQWISWVCNPGDGVIIGGSAYKDHATLGSGAIVGAGSGVTCDACR
jgi:UDP-3-O-[3-hydroxymyristoyl] glucosamine N-acyltransferase